jgi:hypothetical protein
MAISTEQRQLDTFIDRYSPAVAEIARAVLARMRTMFPGATQIVYDNYNAAVIGFGPNERASEAVFSIALYPKWVTLFFLHGAGLPDPDGVLQGSGKLVRHIRLTGGAADLDQPHVRALMKAAVRSDKAPMDDPQQGRLVVRSISPKQRPRRASAKVAQK